jgi:hypothetical protein
LKTFFIPPFSVFYYIILVHFFIIYPIEKAAEKERITVDELTERAMKKLLERSDENVRN